MTKRFLITVGIMGTLCVMFGAIGAHILEGNISNNNLIKFNTANEFLMYHSLALLGLTFMNRYVSRSYLNTIYYLFVIGIILFSGTLYLSSIRELASMIPESFGKLTPIGGILLIVGWLTLVVTGINYTHRKRNN